MQRPASNKQVIHISPPLVKKLSNPNNEELYPLYLSVPNNEELYPLHQLYPNNRSGKGADPFLWLFPDPELLLDQYVPYLLQLYSEQSDKIKNDQEIMQFFNNDDSEININ
jgi:hypothetical protein